VSPLHPAVAASLHDVATQRLSLRRLSSDDLAGLAAIFADRDVWRFEHERGMTRVETQAFLDRQLKLWADFGFGGCGVRELASQDLIGVVGLAVPTIVHELLPAVTVGWRFSPTMWRKGYATEAATAVLDQAFTTMALDRVGCVANHQNLPSVRVAERLGMSLSTEASVPTDDGDEGTRMVTVVVFRSRVPTGSARATIGTRARSSRSAPLGASADRSVVVDTDDPTKIDALVRHFLDRLHG
jgi:RimJ/RimL family protein N-acetyltransferase